MVLFNYYPVVVSSVVVFGFLFNKTSLSFVVYILNILLLYSSFGLGLDALYITSFPGYRIPILLNSDTTRLFKNPLFYTNITTIVSSIGEPSN